MTFAHPWFLTLLLLLPLLAWLKGRRGQPPAFVYSSVQLVRAVLNVTRSRSGGLLAALRWLALALLIVAFAQPRLSTSETKISASGIDIVVALDRSSSMLSEDFVVNRQRLNRMAMAKQVLDSFIGERPSDRFGLVVFARRPYIATPVTLDHDFLGKHIARLGPVQRGGPEDGTAIGDGLAAAVNRLRELNSKSKIVLLMTDGVNNTGKVLPVTAADAARALEVKVYTIGVGKQGTAPMPRGRDIFGNIVYDDEPVQIDEETLMKVADITGITGGKYYRADNAERFREIYAEIDALEKSDADVKKYTHHNNMFPWFISPGLGLLLIELVLRHTLLRRIP
jgi:Ca-activated chloride channel family protein